MTTNRNQAGRTAIRRVIAGVDGSQSAMHAALWAAREAESRGVPLTLAHALHLPHAAVTLLGPDNYAERWQAVGDGLVRSVAARIRELHPRLIVATDISPFSAIDRLAELSTQDVLVVTGTRGHGGFTGMLLGSVSRTLAARAEGPLIVVCGPEPEEARGAVVLGVGPRPAESVVEYAFAAARRHGAPLRVVRAWAQPASTPLADVGLPGSAAFGVAAPGVLTMPGAPAMTGVLAAPKTLDSDDGEAADAALAIEPVHARYPEVKVEVTAAVGDPVSALTDAGAQARLIVVGAHRRRGLFAIGAGHVVEGLLSHSPVPVAVIPAHPAHQVGDENDG